MQIQLLSGVEQKGLREYRTMTQSYTDPNQLKRLGVLIGLKIDWNRTGEKLRWGYLKTESLRARGLNDAQIANLKAKLAEAEAVYTKLGGDRKDFAKAIVEGNGNRDQIVITDYESLGNISIRPEERVLLTAPAQLLMDIQAVGLGNTAVVANETNQNAVAFEKAGTTLSKISQIASGVSTITGSLATITNKETGTTVNASIDDAPPAQAGFGFWMSENKKTIMAGGALLLAGLFITKMKHSDEDPGRRPKAGRKFNRAKKKRKSKSGLGSLGIIELS